MWLFCCRIFLSFGFVPFSAPGGPLQPRVPGRGRPAAAARSPHSWDEAPAKSGRVAVGKRLGPDKGDPAREGREQRSPRMLFSAELLCR